MLLLIAIIDLCDMIWMCEPGTMVTRKNDKRIIQNVALFEICDKVTDPLIDDFVRVQIGVDDKFRLCELRLDRAFWDIPCCSDFEYMLTLERKQSGR